MAGKAMISQVKQVVGGSNTLSLDFSTLSKGIYIVKIGNGQNAIHQKLVLR